MPPLRLRAVGGGGSRAIAQGRHRTEHTVVACGPWQAEQALAVGLAASGAAREAGHTPHAVAGADVAVVGIGYGMGTAAALRGSMGNVEKT